MAEQRIQQDQICRIVESKVIPAKAQEYEEILNDWLKLLRQNKFSAAIALGIRSDSKYQFWSYAENFSHMEKIIAEYQEIIQKKEGQDLMSRIADTSIGQDIYILRTRLDLCYFPKTPRLSSESEALFGYLSKIYIKYGFEDKIDAFFKKAANQRREKNIRMGHLVTTALTGNNLPFYEIVTNGRNAADYWSAIEEMRQELGGLQEENRTELFSMLRGYDSASLQMRFDLSYRPE